MRRRSSSMLPWLVAAGSLTAAWYVWRKAMQPQHPDLALQAGLELTSRPRRVLAIGPHPDDLECFAGGTIRLLTQNGSAVTMAVLSLGEQATNRANIAEIRSREAEQGATILGANLIQVGLPDGQIRPGPVLESVLDHLWEQVAPEIILAFDPSGPLPLANNPDHLALGAAVIARARRGMRNGERLYFYGTQRPNVLVDITEVLEEKTNSLRAHRSQLFGPDWITRPFTAAVSRLYSSKTPAMYAEGFYRLS